MAKKREDEVKQEEVAPEPEPEVAIVGQKFNAAALADAKGLSRFEFDALVQMGEIKYEDEITEAELEALVEKHYSEKNLYKPGGE